MKNHLELKILNPNQNGQNVGKNIKEVTEFRKEEEEKDKIFLEMKKEVAGAQGRIDSNAILIRGIEER